FPSRYWYTIGLSGVFSLTGWCRQIQPGFLLSRPTQDTRQHRHPSLTGLSPSTARIPIRFRSRLYALRRSYNPAHALTCTVWAPPLSLATTNGITVVFSSSGYLDVSVPRVSLPCGIPAMRREGCPIRKPADQPVCAGPRGLSQLAASFFASESLGIPRAPLITSTPGTARAAPGCPRPKPGDFKLQSLLNISKNLCPKGKAKHAGKLRPSGIPERRCSSRTFRYGYLVTT